MPAQGGFRFSSSYDHAYCSSLQCLFLLYPLRILQLLRRRSACLSQYVSGCSGTCDDACLMADAAA